MNIPTEDSIITSLCKLHYLKGVIIGSVSDKIPFNDYMDCLKYCDYLISLLQGMIEDKEGD